MVNALELDDVFAGSRALVIFSTLSFPSLVAFSSLANMARLTAGSVSLRAQPHICVSTLQTSELRCGLSFRKQALQRVLPSASWPHPTLSRRSHSDPPVSAQSIRDLSCVHSGHAGGVEQCLRLLRQILKDSNCV